MMSYTLSWYTPDEVIYLELHDQPNVEELKEVNQHISELLETRENRVSLVINATKMAAGHHTSEHLRETQKYMDNPKIKQAVFVSSNKLNRLITLMAFSMSRVRLLQFDTWQVAVDHMKRQGFDTTLSA